MAESNDVTHEPSIIDNLAIISSIESGDKISWYEDKFYIYKWDYYQGLRRWWNSETRNASISKLEEFIELVFKSIDSIISAEIPNSNANSYYNRSKNKKNPSLKDETKEKLKEIITNLLSSINGLQNLKQTYENDLPICSSIDILIEKITVRTKKIDDSYLKSN